MPRSTFEGTIHTQYRFPIAAGVEIHPGQLYGFDADGRLVRVEDAETGRRVVCAMERATGDAAATRKALCAVSVIALIPRDALTGADRGKSVYATSGQSVQTSDNGKRCGVLLEVDNTTAAILLG